MRQSARDKALNRFYIAAACMALIVLVVRAVSWNGESTLGGLMLSMALAFICIGVLLRQWLYFQRHISQLEAQTDTLQRIARLDSFTGLYNKQHAQELINTYITQPISTPYTLFMLDINNLKGINDRYGHCAGDAVILRLSNALKPLFSKQDILGRVGGDEFIALAQLNETQAVALAQSLIKRLTLLNHEGNPELQVSIGLASIPPEGMSFETAYRLADKAMYHAKQQPGSGYAVAEDENIIRQ